MRDDPKFHAVIPAAGAGTRMAAGMPKQYLQLAGKTVLENSLDALLASERIDKVVLVLAVDDEYWPSIQNRYKDSRVETVSGGAERSQSVLNGLDHLAVTANENDWALVHDAVRPCLQQDDIDSLLSVLEGDPVGGLLGVPVTDTMKQVNAEGAVIKTLERDDLWRALTPQMFRLGALRDALRRAITAGAQVTDEASAMELAGQRPRMILGHADNIKITRPGDLQLAEFYLQSRQKL